MPDNIIQNGDCGYWMYLGVPGGIPTASGEMKHIDPAQLDYGHQPLTEYTDSHSTPRVLTRAEKGQALTHLEMDFNLASLFYKLNTSSKGAPYDPEENAPSPSPSGTNYGVDKYFQRHKPTRAEEMEGLFATFSYAPVVNDGQTVIQNPFQTIKVQHTTDELRYKLSNERIPGTLDIQEDFRVTGSTFILQDCNVGGNISCSHDIQGYSLKILSSSEFKEIRASGTASFDGDVYVKGNLYVNGVLFGNLSQPEYNSLTNPNYAQQYIRWGVQDTGSQSDARLKLEPTPIYDALDKVESIRGYEFDWAPEAEKSGHDVGLIAQEVAEVLPEAVATGKDGYLRLDYTKVVPLLVQAVKELKWEVEKLKSRK